MAVVQDFELDAKLAVLRQQIADLQAQVSRAGQNALGHGVNHIDGTDPIWGSQTANTFWGAPNGSAGGPSWRVLATGDMPSYTATILLTAPGADLPLTTPCAALTQAESTTNDVNYEYLAFDSATDEYCYWPPIPLPDGITGTTVSVVPYWTASSGTGTVAWTFQMQVRANDGAIDQAWGTAAASTDTLLATGDWHIGPAVTVTPSGTITGGDILVVRMFRDVSEDTLNADAWFLAAKVEFTRSYSD